jgi:hypothetical protein
MKFNIRYGKDTGVARIAATSHPAAVSAQKESPFSPALRPSPTAASRANRQKQIHRGLLDHAYHILLASALSISMAAGVAIDAGSKCQRRPGNREFHQSQDRRAHQGRHDHV